MNKVAPKDIAQYLILISYGPWSLVFGWATEKEKIVLPPFGSTSLQIYIPILPVWFTGQKSPIRSSASPCWESEFWYWTSPRVHGNLQCFHVTVKLPARALADISAPNTCYVFMQRQIRRFLKKHACIIIFFPVRNCSSDRSKMSTSNPCWIIELIVFISFMIYMSFCSV